jgi:thiol-disulfide isomerase/thioredoxin
MAIATRHFNSLRGRDAMRTLNLGYGCLLVLTLVSRPLLAQEAPAAAAPTNVNLVSALSQVRWQAAPPTAEVIKDKSSVVLVYATWCPKCNEWSQDLFAQVKQAASDQPVTIFAINADKTSPGSRYALERGFVAPNIIHGFDPGMPARLGFDSDLFKFAAFDSTGKSIDRGEGGSFYTRATGKEFVLASKIREGTYPGEFAILSREMSPELKQLLWPVELGQPITDKTLLKLRNQLPAEQHTDFNSAIRAYLDKQITRCETGVQGEVPQQIEAYSSAKLLAERFGSTPQGRKARGIVTSFDEQDQFKKELSAATAYQKTVATGGTPAALKRALIKVANRFEGTHYGNVAKEQASTGG